MTSSGKKEFLFIWTIENISFSDISNGRLKSPTFDVPAFENTRWRMHIYPRSCSEHVGCFLNRCDTDGTETHVTLSFLFSFCSPDNILYKRSNLLCHKFSKKSTPESSKGYKNFFHRDHLFGLSKKEILTKDALKIVCQMWMGRGEVVKAGMCWARSTIGVNRNSISWPISNFSNMEPDEEKNVDVPSSDTDSPLVTMSFSLGWHLNNRIKLYLDLSTPSPLSNLGSNYACKICLVDRVGNFVECVNDQIFRKTPNTKEVWRLILGFTMQELLSDKETYLPNDTLTLHCEFANSDGKLIYSEIENMFNETEMNCESNCGDSSVAIKGESMRLDFGRLWDDGILTDVELKTKTKSFLAHSVVLAARSPVFRAMFTNDMKEKQEKIVPVPDFDDDTVSRVLQYAYKETVDDLEWDSAVSLYSAADKYQMLSLRRKCSSILERNISLKNGCRCLVLADMCQDVGLKSFVQKFIGMHYRKVFKSYDWKQLEKENSSLAIETFRKIFLN